ncbi:MAG: PIN domain-containing protein [Anaerolineae bacterium]|nr:PIN domain-containing protein [Anaerolineae bacterium]
MTALETAFASISRLALDSSPIIYFVEAHPRYDALVTTIFQRIAEGQIEGITSTLTLTEVLALPMEKGQHDLCQTYRKLLTSAAHFTLVSIGSEIAERAAELRARYHLRTPDALQVAAALLNDCQAFLTNDKGLSRITEVEVLVLEALL